MFALKNIYQKDGWLPVNGGLPDMTSETNYYINMKKIYEKRAKEDKESVIKEVEKILSNLGESDEYMPIIADPRFNLIDIICKNWSQMSLFKYSEFETHLPITAELDYYEQHSLQNIIWYFLTKASELYNDKYGHYPVYSSNKEEYSKIKIAFLSQIKEYFNSGEFPEIINLPMEKIEEKCIDEFLRNSRLLITPVISIVGSNAAQEIIKLLTFSFETVNNTILFDAMNVCITNHEMKKSS